MGEVPLKGRLDIIVDELAKQVLALPSVSQVNCTKLQETQLYKKYRKVREEGLKADTVGCTC